MMLSLLAPQLLVSAFPPRVKHAVDEEQTSLKYEMRLLRACWDVIQLRTLILAQEGKCQTEVAQTWLKGHLELRMACSS